VSDYTRLQPRRPTHLPDYAEVCLKALSAEGLGAKISLGGALGLLHFWDYRATHDVDTWWAGSSTDEERQFVIQTIEAALRPFGQVQRRAWGDVVSIELRREGEVVFSFQIAERTVQLQPTTSAPWTDVLLDSFPDLVASKMVALVERGAPRDFRDIHAVCQAGLIRPDQCWELWKMRQRLADSDTDTHRARLAVDTHLSRIAQHRPLDRIEDPAQREEAKGVRRWLAGEFLDALVD
jgi:hypothetical protein